MQRLSRLSRILTRKSFAIVLHSHGFLGYHRRTAWDGDLIVLTRSTVLLVSIAHDDQIFFSPSPFNAFIPLFVALLFVWCSLSDSFVRTQTQLIIRQINQCDQSVIPTECLKRSSALDDDDVRVVSLPLSHLKWDKSNSSHRRTYERSTRLTGEMRLVFVHGMTSQLFVPAGEKNRITILFFTSPAQEKQINSIRRKITSVLQPIHIQPSERRLPFSSRFSSFFLVIRRLIFNDIREVSFSFFSLFDDDKRNADRFCSFSDWLIVGLFLFV